METTIPKFADTIVIGGGTAGSAIAGELAARSDQSVMLIEAGPDYGPMAGGRWPSELTDARALPTSHDWGYNSGDQYPGRVVNFDRARVIGGCSSHNGCAAIWGSRIDYDGWAALGNLGWSTEELLPLFRAGSERLRVRIPERDEVTPYQLAWLDAAPSAGIPVVSDLNNLDENQGMAPSPANVSNGVRWNAAFAYLDPARNRSNLTIMDNAMVDRLAIRNERVAGVRAIRGGEAIEIDAGRVVLAAGTYGSPAILMRSGVGDPAELRSLGIEVALDLPGVGRNLHDHPLVGLMFAGSKELEESMVEFGRTYWRPEEQTIAKARSSRCSSAFDLHMFPIGGPIAGKPGEWGWSMAVSSVTPRSRGALNLASADPRIAPRIEHRYLSDPEDEDERILVEGVKLARQMAAEPRLTQLLGREKWPGPSLQSETQIASAVRANVAHYCHPVGTCAMGPSQNRGAVVDSRGRVHGLDNCYIADASIMPVIPRANTNIPALIVGLRVVDWLLGS